MNVELVSPGAPVPSSDEVVERHAEALCVPAGPALPPRVDAVRLFALVDACGATAGGACHGQDDSPTKSGTYTVACPHAGAEEAALGARVQAAARLPVDAVVLDRPDAWYEAGTGAGYCGACEQRLNAELARQYGEQYAPYPVMAALRGAGERDDPPFWREHSVLRLRSGIEEGARLARRVRDEVRRARGRTSVGARFAGVGPAAVRLAEKLDFVFVPAPVPRADESGIARYELFRAALAGRPVVGAVDDETAADAERVREVARIATAARATIALPSSAPPASHAALADQRAFWRSFGARYRPPDPYAELLLLYSPACDHHTRGAHGASVGAVAEALTGLGVQYRFVLETPRTGTEPIVLADAHALPEAEAARIDRRVAEGASAIVVGPCRVADDNGRPLEGAFDELSDGLNKAGTGTVFGLDQRPAGDRGREPLAPRLERATESLIGRGRRAVGVSGAGVVAKLFLDPDRKLDVVLAARPGGAAPAPVRGATIYLSGAVASGARTASLFRPSQPEKRVSLTPFGMGVQAALPDFEGEAVLVVDR